RRGGRLARSGGPRAGGGGRVAGGQAVRRRLGVGGLRDGGRRGLVGRRDGRGDGDGRAGADPQAEPETQPAPPPPSDTPIPPPPTDPSGPSANGGQPKPSLAEALSSEAVTKALNSDVPPRDAAERVTFATWAIVTGKSAGGIFNPLPKLDADTAAKMAQRLSERADGPITVEDVQTAETIEALAERVRTYLEAGQIDGFVRTLRARPEGSTKIPVFVFHPAGGSTVVYEPLLKRLPPDTPMYGFERVEGSVQERAAQYVPKLLELNEDNPFVLVGWSLGGALAYACAIGLKRAGADVRFVGLIDTVRAGEEIPQTKEETRKRWDRYARFAERTFNVEIPAIPYEQLEELDDEGQVKFVLDIVQQSGVQIPGGIVEHQRTSYLDNRALETVQIEPYDGHVTLYMADRYHDDVIEFEPRYAIRQPDGGWGEYVADLEVVPIGGEHIQVIDEPIIGKVGAHLTDVLNKVEAQTSQTSEVGK
ncbi:thioesterase domain-containing protein, partial [Mycobacterium avium]|uniref:thioesterase domain-containing protein n=1 Tax=Mycobacterium avium TaxID=1764 RepID=UPI001EEE9B19